MWGCRGHDWHQRVQRNLARRQALLLSRAEHQIGSPRFQRQNGIGPGHGGKADLGQNAAGFQIAQDGRLARLKANPPAICKGL